VQFRDVTRQAGIDFTYRSGREAGHLSILESAGGGVALFDYDNDGMLDMYFTGGGRFHADERIAGVPGALMRGIARLKYADVTVQAGVAADRYYTHGCFVADYDNDGFDDILMTGYGGVQLFRNQGDGTLIDVTEPAGLLDSSWSTGAGWGDVDADGSLDLYLAHYVDWSFANNPVCYRSGSRDVCGPGVFQHLPDRIFLSNGDGSFRDVTSEANLRPGGAGFGVVLVDIDDDGDVDIYVANDTTPNFLYQNDGHGRFQEIGNISGTALDEFGRPNGSMGVDVGDYDGNGQLDIGVANYEGDYFALYRQTRGQFVHVSSAAGLAALGTTYVGWGTVFADFDCDGDEDLMVSNGHAVYFPGASTTVRQKPLLLINEGGRFRRLELDEPSYFSQPHMGRGLACGDLDGDGNLDAVFANCDEPAAVLINEPLEPGTSVMLRLVGTASNRDAIGAKLFLHTTAGSMLRHIKGGGSYLSQNSLTVHFGVPHSAQVKSVDIRWPSGIRQEIASPPVGQLTLIVEPPPTAAPPE